MRKKRYLTIFTRLEPDLLYKDVGAIPYYLAKVCGWESSIAFLQKSHESWQQMKDGKYEKVVNLISLGLVRSKISNAFRVIRFLILRAKDYDVINFYHDSAVAMAYALIYKIFNRSGKTYFKLDMSHLEADSLKDKKYRIIPAVKRKFKYHLSKAAVNIYTVETTKLYNELVSDNYFKNRLCYLPNGIACDQDVDCDALVSGKENIILTVGNIGSYPKYNELLIDAVSMVDENLIKDWLVYFVGPVVNPDFYQAGFINGDEFKKYVEKVVHKYPHLKNTFVFTGKIKDRSALEEIYKKAKIFCLTSRYESFGFVLPEAMYYCNYVISSDLPPSRDLTKEGTIGSLFPVGDVNKLSRLIVDAITGKIDLTKNGQASHEHIKNKFNWRIIIKELDRLLR